MHVSQHTLNQRISRAEPGLPVTFSQLQVSYDDHRDEEALDELVVSRIELRRRGADTYYVLVHVAATTPTGSQDHEIGCIVVNDVPASAQSSPPPDCLQSILHPFSRSRTARIPSAQVIDRNALQLPLDDVCVREHTFPGPCPLTCVISAGLSVATQIPDPGHGKQRSSWCAALTFWLLVGEDEKIGDAFVLAAAARSAAGSASGYKVAPDDKRCTLKHNYARRPRASGWKADVEELEREVARGGR